MTGLIKAATVKARKDYACMCCGALAARAGDEYRRETYVFDGRIYDWVSCDPCQSITGDVFEWAMAPDEGVGPEVDMHYPYALVGTPCDLCCCRDFLEVQP